MKFKVALLTNETRKDGEIKRRIFAKVKELDSMKPALDVQEDNKKQKDNDLGHLELELMSVRAAICSGERLLQDFAERVCTQ